MATTYVNRYLVRCQPAGGSATHPHADDADQSARRILRLAARYPEMGIESATVTDLNTGTVLRTWHVWEFQVLPPLASSPADSPAPTEVAP